MKSVLIAIQPKWCELIANGKKTVEVRKAKPKSDVPFKCYIYETQGRTETPFVDEEGHYIFKGRGQVIGEFVCDRIDEYTLKEFEWEKGDITLEYHIPTIEGEKTCLEYDEVREYGNGKPLYFWHISNLVIYDKLRELGEFRYECNGICYSTKNRTKCKKFLIYGYDCNGLKLVERPPQSWCYVEELGV